MIRAQDNRNQMATCFYHPDKKSTFVCPDCGEDVCDTCRLEGGLQRCGNCATNGPPPDGSRVRKGGDGGNEQAGYADGGGEGGEITCTNHPFIAADMQCLNCLQAYCMTCLPDGQICADCRKNPAAFAAEQSTYVPPDYSEDLGYAYEDLGDMDFAAGYASQPAEETERRPRRAPGSGGGKKAPSGGKKGAPAAKKGLPPKKGAKGRSPVGLIAAGVGALLLVAGGAFFAMGGMDMVGGGGKPPEGFTGQAKVQITAPTSVKVSGNQVIQLKVGSADLIEKVEIHVDGKYWDKFKGPPFKSDWPTSLLKNGNHEITAIAAYKNGPTVRDKKTVFVTNKK